MANKNIFFYNYLPDKYGLFWDTLVLLDLTASMTIRTFWSLYALLVFVAKLHATEIVT